MASKTQRLRTTAEGFMAGLVACGYRGPWRWSNLDWEASFYRAWDGWPPAQRSPADFPRFELGGTGSTSQAREMLWQLKSTSPFSDYKSEALPEALFGLTAVEYLKIWAGTASPDEWTALARDFLSEMHDAGH